MVTLTIRFFDSRTKQFVTRHFKGKSGEEAERRMEEFKNKNPHMRYHSIVPPNFTSPLPLR